MAAEKFINGWIPLKMDNQRDQVGKEERWGLQVGAEARVGSVGMNDRQGEEEKQKILWRDGKSGEYTVLLLGQLPW